MNTEVYINDNLIDIDDDETIVATYGNITFGELNKRKGIKSNTFTAPFSQRNKMALESCELPNSDSMIPYRKNIFRVDISGVTVFEGFCVIEGAEDGYNIQSFAGASDFYSVISQSKLSVLDLSAYDHVWGETAIRNSWNRTDGYIYAYAEYGKHDLPSDGFYPFIRTIPPDYLMPQIFFHTVIKAIAAYMGYAISGAVLQDERFLKHLILVNKFPLPISYGGTFSLSALLPDVAQSKVWLDFANIYGQQFEIDDVENEIRCTYIDDILFNDPEDWSSKIDMSENRVVKYSIDNYGQSSYLKFKSDSSTDTNSADIDYSKGIPIDDNTLDPEADVYKSEFYLIQNERFPLTGIPGTKTFIIKKDSAYGGVWNSVNGYAVGPGIKLYVWRNGSYYLALQNPVPAGKDPIIETSYWSPIAEKDIWETKYRPMYGVLKIDPASPMTVAFSTPRNVNRVVVADGLEWSKTYQSNYRVFDRIIKKTKSVELLVKLNYADVHQIRFDTAKIIDRELYVLEEVTQFKLNKPDSTICKFIRL